MLQSGNDKERRSSLRRLDDILDTLEQLNLHDRTELTEGLAESLVLLGVDSPYSTPIPQLIERVRATVLPLAGTEPGRAQLTVGAGGDRTMELDRAAEADVFAELEALAGRGERFAVLSEEAGHRKFGADYPLVLVDPVDGSLNAKQRSE